MGIDLTIDGKPFWNASNYAVQEDSTPVDPNDSSGAFGQFTFDIPDFEGSKKLRKKTVELVDGTQGSTTGIARSANSDGNTVTIAADSRLGALSVIRTAQPFSGTLDGAFRYYLGLVGITDGIVTDPAIIPPTRTNPFNNPSGRRTTAGYVAVGAGSLGRDAGADTYFQASGANASGAGGLTIESMTIGAGKLLPNTTYTFSASIYAGAASGPAIAYVPKIQVSGSGVAVSMQIAGGSSGFNRVSITFTTIASGTVVFSVLNTGAAMALGNVVAFRDAQIDAGTVATLYFDGNTGTTTPFLDYYWTGLPDASPSISGPTQFVFPGWNGNAWLIIKQMASAQSVEIALASDDVVMRPFRQRTAVTARDASVGWATSDSNTAQSVEVYYYETEVVTNGLVYPLGGWTPDVEVQSVNAGATTKYTVDLVPSTQATDGSQVTTGPGASITSIQQPVCVTSVDENYSASSVYTVTGSDGLPIPPAEWAAGGGSVTVAIGEDTQSLIFTIVGSNDTQYAPYDIAMASGTSNEYSSLRIVGSGVFYNRQVVTLRNGNDPDLSPTVIGATVDNPFITSYEQAWRTGLWTLAAFTGPTMTVSVTSTGINQVGDSGSYVYPTMGDFNAEYAGMTMGAWNALHAGMSMGDFDAEQFALVQGDFANQAFGNVGGARYYSDFMWYRIRTVSDWSPTSIQFTAERDTTFADFNEVHAGMTMGQFNALHATDSMGDYSMTPLYMPPTLPISLDVAYPDTFYPDTNYPA